LPGVPQGIRPDLHARMVDDGRAERRDRVSGPHSQPGPRFVGVEDSVPEFIEDVQVIDYADSRFGLLPPTRNSK
jgi:hypothetical protein